jgi:hypothetical protein
MKFKLDANHCALLLGIAIMCGLKTDATLAVLLGVPMIRMIVDFCKYRPPVQHNVTNTGGAARPVARRGWADDPAAAYVGPRLIQGPSK